LAINEFCNEQLGAQRRLRRLHIAKPSQKSLVRKLTQEIFRQQLALEAKRAHLWL